MFEFKVPHEMKVKMTKTKVSMLIDVETYIQAKSEGINMSKVAREALRFELSRLDKNIDGINIELERIRRERVKKRLEKIQLEYKDIEDNIKRWDEKMKAKKEADLKAKKEQIEKLETCIHCKSVVKNEKFKKKFPKGMVCHSCYQAVDGETLKSWL